jgi:hypothetical protein
MLKSLLAGSGRAAIEAVDASLRDRVFCLFEPAPVCRAFEPDGSMEKLVGLPWCRNQKFRARREV